VRTCSPDVSLRTAPAEVTALRGRGVEDTATKPPPAKQVSTTPSDVMSQKTPVIFKILVWVGRQKSAHN